MHNPFSKIASVFVWLWSKIDSAAHWLPRLITTVETAKTDLTQLIPMLVKLLDDVAELVAQAVKDSGAAITSLRGLVSAIVAALEAHGLNVASDAQVAADFQAFINSLKDHGTFLSFLDALHQLTADYGAFITKIKGSLAELEADVEGKPTPALAADSPSA